jgi:hypothetical protein
MLAAGRQEQLHDAQFDALRVIVWRARAFFECSDSTASYRSFHL